MSKYSESQFNKAVELIGSLPKDGPVKPSQAQQLTFYGLFKQANVGDVNTSRPGMMDFTGKAKWDAWKKNEGKSKEDAMHEYVEEFVKILDESDAEEAKKHKETVLAA